MVLIYGSFSTGKTTYLQNHLDLVAVDTDVFYYMYTGALKRNAFAYLEDANAWLNMAQIIKQMVGVKLIITNNYGPINDVFGKFQLAFTSSPSRVEYMLSKTTLSTELNETLKQLLARESLYLQEYAHEIIILQKDEYISDYAIQISQLLKE